MSVFSCHGPVALAKLVLPHRLLSRGWGQAGPKEVSGGKGERSETMLWIQLWLWGCSTGSKQVWDDAEQRHEQ